MRTFSYKGWICFIKHFDRITTGGHYCGYVSLKKGYSKYMNQDYADSKLSVHGGVTFSSHALFSTDDTSVLIKGNIIGFDCAHAEDDPQFGGTVKDEKFVENELKSMVDQLRKRWLWAFFQRLLGR